MKATDEMRASSAGAPRLWRLRLAPGARAAARSAERAPRRSPVGGGRLRVEVCADDIVRVAFAKDDAFFAPAVADGGAETMHVAGLEADPHRTTATIATAKLRVNVDLATGAVVVPRRGGRPIAAERAGTRR